jgi:hypothetical protein
MANYRIDTAFRSFRHNECYFITNGRCLVLDYFKKSIVNGPRHIENVFPILRNTPFRRRIDCTFNGDENEIFIFSRNLCAKIRYTAEGRLFNRPISINRMFPRLPGTSFENGIDAAFKYVRVDLERKREEYDQKELIFIKHIIQFIEVTNCMPYLFCK